MSNLLSTIKSETKLFKQPYQIGDVVEIESIMFLLIDIEKFSIRGQKLTIWFTAQDLSKGDYISTDYHILTDQTEQELEILMKYDDERWRDFQLGSTFVANDKNRYKLVEYTGISLKGTDLYVTAIGKLVRPVNRKEARTKYVEHRKKILKLDVY